MDQKLIDTLSKLELEDLAGARTLIEKLMKKKRATAKSALRKEFKKKAELFGLTTA